MHQKQWHFPRHDFASRILRHYDLIQTLTLFSPRRTGKTTFVKQDLIPAANQAGLAPLYVDMWLNRENTGLALVEAMRLAYRQLTVPESATMRTLRQPVTSVRVLGMGISLGALPEPGEPEDDIARIAYWMQRVLEASDRPILLIVDEAQAMAVEPNGSNVAATLRSLLQAHEEHVWAFFTGSSQHNLARLLGDAAAPFYQFGQQIKLPELDREFSDFLADRFEDSAPQHTLHRDALYNALLALDRAPGPFVEMVIAMLMANRSDIAPFLGEQREKNSDRIEQLIEARGLTTRELAVATRIAHGLAYTSRHAMAFYAQFEPGDRKIGSTQVRRAVNKLVDGGLLDRGMGHGEVFVASETFRRYLTENFPVTEDENRQ